MSAQPFVKWAGGKGKLTATLLDALPTRNFNSYFEPFLGGGAFFYELAAAGLLKRGQVWLSDACLDLVRVYRAIATERAALVVGLDSYWSSVREGQVAGKARFMHVRSSPPEDRQKWADAELGAWFIFLNKTCWNGLWRVNRKDIFNVPWGKFKNPSLYDAENLESCERLFRELAVAFNHCSYDFIEGGVEAGDLVYFDPPYLPDSATADFTQYTPLGFGVPEHRELARFARSLKARGVHVMLSNSDHPLISEIYEGFRIQKVQVRRNIAADGEKRKSVGEVIIT